MRPTAPAAFSNCACSRTGGARGRTIVPGNFGGNGATDLLFYDPSALTGEFYATTGSGGIEQIRQHTDWRGSWTEILPGEFGGSGHTDLLFYDRTDGTGQFYSTDGHGGISEVRTHTDWRRSWSTIVPGVFAPLQAMRLHLKILKMPVSFSIARQLASMREVYASAGVRVLVGSTEVLNLPHLLDVDVGDCVVRSSATTSPATSRSSPGIGTSQESGEMVIYFVRQTMKASAGCAHHPPNRPGAIVTEGRRTGRWPTKWVTSWASVTSTTTPG